MRIGLYPGTFDPITLGHIDIIRRACSLVDKLVIGVAINRDKGPLFDLEERVAMIEEESAHLSAQTGCEIVAHPFENLLIHCARDVGATVIVRGLRAVADCVQVLAQPRHSVGGFAQAGAVGGAGLRPDLILDPATGYAGAAIQISTMIHDPNF